MAEIWRKSRHILKNTTRVEIIITISTAIRIKNNKNFGSYIRAIFYIKFKTAAPKLFKENDNCRIVEIDSLDNTEVAPLLMNARDDSPDLVSTAVPMGVQQNASFIVDSDAFPTAKIYFVMTDARLKFFTVSKEGSKVVRIEKVGTQQDADIAIRTSYICKFCTSFK